jgi:hypothetical protein
VDKDDSLRGIVDRYMASHVAPFDWETMAAIQHADFVCDWPQSHERVRGHDNYRAIIENYPGGLVDRGVEFKKVVGTEDRWVMGPMLNPLRVEGMGDTFTIAGIARYPSGESWHFMTLIRMKDGKIYRQTDYWGPPLDAPEWRSKWVERTADDSATLT